MKKHVFLTILLVALSSAMAFAQGLPRIFVDIPSISIFSPDVENFNDVFGAGAATHLNVGTHWGVARAGGGVDALIRTRDNNDEEQLYWSPYVNSEIGLGMFRSNGNKCAAHNQSAFTAMGLGGIRYDFKGSSASPYFGAEFGYFYIKDIFKNQEGFVRGEYFTESKTFAVRAGFRVFLNVKADMSKRY